MKTLLCLGFGGALLLASPVWAQTVPCGGDDGSSASDIQGAATFEIQSTANPCHGPAVDTSFGPFPLMSTLPVTTTTTKVLVISETMVSETAPPDDAAVKQDLKSQQLRRLGELDAMQGKPLNMLYADDLSYVQGYTQGQQGRQAVPGPLRTNEPRRGFVGF